MIEYQKKRKGRAIKLDCEFNQNQYDKEGVYLDPDIGLKTLTITCDKARFLDFYLMSLGLTTRHLYFFKLVLEHCGRAGDFKLKDFYHILEERGIAKISSEVYIAELKHYTVNDEPLLIPVSKGNWKVNKKFLYWEKEREFRIYVLCKDFFKEGQVVTATENFDRTYEGRKKVFKATKEEMELRKEKSDQRKKSWRDKMIKKNGQEWYDNYILEKKEKFATEVLGKKNLKWAKDKSEELLKEVEVLKQLKNKEKDEQ